MDKFSLVYIDDNPDTALSEYLARGILGENYEITCQEIIFNPETGYKTLLSDSRIRRANIILIDSWLFENRTVADMKFTGEEFKLILRKFFPFIEVIVITQNPIEPGIMKIAKYNNRLSGSSACEYYAQELSKVIDSVIPNIRQYQLLAAQVEKNDSWEMTLKEKVLATLNGTSAYDDLTTSDIDKLISAFKEMEGCING